MVAADSGGRGSAGSEQLLGAHRAPAYQGAPSQASTTWPETAISGYISACSGCTRSYPTSNYRPLVLTVRVTRTSHAHMWRACFPFIPQVSKGCCRRKWRCLCSRRRRHLRGPRRRPSSGTMTQPAALPHLREVSALLLIPIRRGPPQPPRSSKYMDMRQLASCYECALPGALQITGSADQNQPSTG